MLKLEEVIKVKRRRHCWKCDWQFLNLQYLNSPSFHSRQSSISCSDTFYPAQSTFSVLMKSVLLFLGSGWSISSQQIQHKYQSNQVRLLITENSLGAILSLFFWITKYVWSLRAHWEFFLATTTTTTTTGRKSFETLIPIRATDINYSLTCSWICMEFPLLCDMEVNQPKKVNKDRIFLELLCWQISSMSSGLLFGDRGIRGSAAALKANLE